MLISWRTPLLAAVCSLAVLIGPALSLAEDAAQPQTGTTQSAPADASGAPHGTTGCPHSEGGACCGACQEKAEQGQAHEHAEAGGPCQHAEKAPHGS